MAAADEGRAATVAPATAAPWAPFAGELGLPLQRLFSSDDYDGFSRVTAVADTAEGFTVFGTYHAAIFFDGVTYEKIPVPATYVTALCRDHDGVLWAGGDNELGVIAADPADGQLRYATHTNLLPPAARTFGRLRGMVASRAGIFAATSNGVLHLTNWADFLPLPPASRPRLFAVGGRVYLQDVRRGSPAHGADGFRPVDTGRDLVGRELELVERDATHALCLIDGEGVFTLSLATGRLEALATPLAPLLTGPLVWGSAPAGRTHGLSSGATTAAWSSPTRHCKAPRRSTPGTWARQHRGSLDAALDADRGLWLATANGLLRLDLGPGSAFSTSATPSPSAPPGRSSATTACSTPAPLRACAASCRAIPRPAGRRDSSPTPACRKSATTCATPPPGFSSARTRPWNC